MSKKASCCGSNCKHPEDKSEKTCTCGGHNQKNHKKSKTHNGTKSRNNVRKSRKVKEKEKWKTATGDTLW